METKANYIIVGVFTLAAIVAAFAFVYWTAAIGDKGETAMLRVRIPGSASGLGRGSFVLFNGIKVGDIKRVYIDVNNPTVAIADAEIDVTTPLTKSTKADIGLAGLTGQANIELKGGDPHEPKLLDEAAKEGRIAEITANPSAVTNLLQTAQNIFTRADKVLSDIEGFTKDARQPLTQTVQNAQKFSDALAKNADGIDKFLTSVSSLSEQLQAVSGKLDSTLQSANDLLTSVDRDKIKDIVANVDTVTANLKDTSQQLTGVIDDAHAAVGTIKDFAQNTQTTLDKVNGIIDSVDPAAVRDALGNIQKVTQNADKAATNIAALTDRFAARADDIDQTIANAKQVSADVAAVTDKVAGRADDIDQTIRNAQQLSARLNEVSVRVDGVLSKADDVLGSVDPATVRVALDNIQKASASADKAASDIAKVTGKFADGAGDIQDTISNAKKASADVAELTDRFAKHGDDIDQTIADARQLAQRLNDASVRVDGILARVDKLLGSGEAEGVMADASATLKSFKQVADTLNAKLGVITDNLARFSGQGLQDVQALVQESRRSVGRIEEAVTDLQRNPQRILSGGAGEVRQYDGRVRR